MEPLDYRKIRAFCLEAIEIAEEFGPEDGLAFLIGEKLSPLILDLKNARKKMRFLYNDEEREAVKPLVEKDQAYRLNYMMSVENNYKQLTEEVSHLEQLQSDFINEILENFEEGDILDYLDGYPRMEKHSPDAIADRLMEEIDPGPITADDLIEEANDIFLIEEIRNLIQKKDLTQ